MPSGPVVSDTGPIQYLVLVDAIDTLSVLFPRVLIPDAVAVELSHPATPVAVRAWLGAAPAWLEREAASEAPSLSRPRGAGEAAAIRLARSVDAQLVLVDDRAGDTAARACGLKTTGTLGVLIRAAQGGLIDLPTSFARLRTTNFRCHPDLLDALEAKYGARV